MRKLLLSCCWLGAIALIGRAEPDSAQYLPISAHLQIGEQRIALEVPQTPEQYDKGLMFRSTLPNDRGMYFRFDPPRPVNFWMRNTLYPIDMVFIYQGRVQQVLAHVPPCETTDCPTYGSALQPISAVLELRAGRAAELGLNRGVTVQFEPLATPQTVLP